MKATARAGFLYCFVINMWVLSFFDQRARVRPLYLAIGDKAAMENLWKDKLVFWTKVILLPV